MFTRVMLDNYLSTAKSEHTQRAYRRWLSKLFAGDEVVDLDDFRFYEAELSTKLRNKQISQNSFNQAVNALNGFKSYCRKNYSLQVGDSLGTVKINSVKSKKYIPKDLRDYVIMDLTENVKTLTKAKFQNQNELYLALRNRLIFFLLLHGLRREEIVALNVCNVDTQSNGKWKITINGKYEKKRVVFMSNESALAMKEYLLSSIVTNTLNTEDSPLIATCEGKRLSDDTVYSLVKKWLGSDYSPHSFRASQATDMFSRGEDLLTIMKWFGWENPQTAKSYDLRYLDNIDLASEMIS